MVTITKTVAKRMMGEVPEDKRFWCYDGRVFKSLQELEAAFNEMTEETFRYHSNETKNDFSNWVRDVIGDEKMALDLQKSTSAAKAAKIVATRVAWLKSRK